MSIFELIANVRHNRKLKRDGLLGNIGDKVPTNNIVETYDEKMFHLSDGAWGEPSEYKDLEWNVIAKYGDDES